MCFFVAKDRLREDTKIHRDFGCGVNVEHGLMMRQQWQFSAAKVADFEVVRHDCFSVARKRPGLKREQRP